ncbi:DUF397 domain-containing protein [Streptomyces sp. CB02923]|uniref:DUF397 domain-containing protein n=1 Tax=Streptomyces sp. CB02923 TaxID=1718985 RepID=UPI00093CD7DA|nr:DUF397 domain-containing protein [Streptomyces sp. CB02923]OKH99834.1 DUF397 domain-containing protein [Streptomyces sp. CB02923]
MTSLTTWQKSSYSEATGNCVEIRTHDGMIEVRESDNPGDIITTTRTKFEALILGVKAGDFDHAI